MKRSIQISTPSLSEEEWHALREPIFSGWVTQGPKVGQFEKAFAERHAVKHALATTSCTTALHLALAALDVGPGDEVIVPAFTWVATANVAVYCGATPVFADVSRQTFNLDPSLVAERITPKTKAVIAVHLFGLCAEMEELRRVVPDHIPIVEDAACAAGGAYLGRPAGGLGAVAAFSFHPRKSITTGEGGMITTDDDGLAERMNAMRNHGATVSEEVRHHGPKPYLLPDFPELGYNYRMTDLQGAIGVVQLSKLDQFVAERAERAEWYRQQLVDLDWLRTPQETNQCTHAWQAFVCYVDPDIAPIARNDIMQRLQDQGIATRPGTHAVHMLTYYRNMFGHKAEDFPAARDCDANTMAIPLHNKMSDDDYDYVVKCLLELV